MLKASGLVLKCKNTRGFVFKHQLKSYGQNRQMKMLEASATGHRALPCFCPCHTVQTFEEDTIGMLIKISSDINLGGLVCYDVKNCISEADRTRPKQKWASPGRKTNTTYCPMLGQQICASQDLNCNFLQQDLTIKSVVNTQSKW